jgi:hypothetical protein
MNDLEHDLRELLGDRAGSLPVSAAAPEAVLQRARRRQVGVVAAGAAFVVAVITIGVGSAVIVGSGRNSIPIAPPIAPPSFPERTATIHGIPVTAPAGWTVIDDWPLAETLPASSESCSFTGTASAIPPSAAGITGSTEPSAEASPSCTSEPISLPAGVPVLQLANFGFSLDGAVCRVGDLRVVDVPADGVALYVAAFDGPMKTADVLDACSGSQNLTTFADRSVRQLYVAVSIVGPDAAAADVATIDRMMNDLGGLRIPDEQAVDAFPGYVVASGDDGTTSWRIEAGFPLLGSGSGIGVTLITTDTDGHETVSGPVPPPAPSEGDEERAERLGDGTGWVQWGTTAPGTVAVTSEAPDGTRTPASLVPWPDGMRPLVRTTEQTQLDGSIWFAIVTERGQIELTGGGTPT